MRSAIWLPVGIAIAVTATANEVTIKNDSLVDNSGGTIQAGFVSGEKAAAWLTTPCDGNIVAIQVFWTSLFGGAEPSLQESIDIYRSGTFPEPGNLALEVGGPLLTDGVLNEFRYVDDDSTIPLIVPVVQDETFVVALTFAEAPDPTQGPSVVNDNDGIEPSRNAIYAHLGGGNYVWFSNSDLEVNGDWVIRAVVDCDASATDADVAVTLAADPAQYTAGAELTYTITVDNTGPATAGSTTVVDAFPGAYTGATWTCAATGGASCAPNGSGTIAQNVSLPVGSEIVYTVHGIVAPGTSGTLTNTVTAVVGAPASDPDTTNNSASVDTNAAPADDLIFADGFDPG